MIAVLLLVVATAGSACANPRNTVSPPRGDEATNPLYLVSHGGHTGMVIKRAAIRGNIWPERMDFPDAEYLELGWGDWDFYQARGFSLWKAVKAAFWSNASVLHVVGFSGAVRSYFPHADVIEFQLTQESYERLGAYLNGSYLRNGAARAPPLGRGLYGDSRFYPAQGRFHLFNTCNVWTAEALRAAGYPITPSLAVTAGMLMDRARQYGERIPSTAAGH